MKRKMCEGVNGSAPAVQPPRPKDVNQTKLRTCMNLHEKCNASDTDSQVALIINQSQVGDDPRYRQSMLRELHEFLGVGKVFAAWIQDRIQQYEFVEESVDYVVTVSKTGIRKNVTQKDHHHPRHGQRAVHG